MHRHANGVKTAVLLALMTGLILLVGSWLGGSSGLTIAFLIALGVNGVAYFMSDKLALRPGATHATPRSAAPRIPSVQQTAACRGLRPVANALGALVGDT